jgi:hypothetical protein
MDPFLKTRKPGSGLLSTATMVLENSLKRLRGSGFPFRGVGRPERYGGAATAHDGS